MIESFAVVAAGKCMSFDLHEYAGRQHHAARGWYDRLYVDAELFSEQLARARETLHVADTSA